MPWYGIVSPNQSSVQGGSAFFSVPIDDEHIWYWQITYRTNERLVPNKTHLFDDADDWPPLPPGPPEDNWGQDREAMKDGHFTGFTQMLGTEDFAMFMGQGPIHDRTDEQLCAADTAVVRMRQCLLKAVAEFQEGRTPYLADNPDLDYTKAISIGGLVDEPEAWRELLPGG